MTKPAEFILSSDYATLKNDGSVTASVSFPGGQSILSNAIRAYEETATIGKRNAALRGQIVSSRASSQRYVGTWAAFNRTGTMGGNSVPYSLIGSVYRGDANTLVFRLEVFNPYASTLTTQSGSETVTFYVSTYLSPFES